MFSHWRLQRGPRFAVPSFSGAFSRTRFAVYRECTEHREYRALSRFLCLWHGRQMSVPSWLWLVAEKFNK